MMRVKKAASFKIQLLLITMLCLGPALYAQSGGDAANAGKFKQRLEWSADKNALEYKVEIRSGGKITETFTTSDNFVNLNLPAGSYDYRVTVYDFLGREQDVSAWQKFEISKANEPVFKNVESAAEVDVSAGSKIVLPVEVDNVAAGASVTLVNVKTGEKIKGDLTLSSAAAGAALASGKSEIAKASAEFPKISAGEWKLVVENPSGLKSESPAIVVTTVDKAAEEKARLIAEQKAAEEAKKEEERLAKEAERLAREEEKRLAQEQAEQERLAREEEKRLAAEEAEREKQELLAQKEAEKAEKEEERQKKKAERAAKKALGIEIRAGAATALNLFDSDLLSNKNFDPLVGALSGVDLPEYLTPAPVLAISYVPNLNWVFTPGLEISASGFFYEERSTPYGGDEYEYSQRFSHNNIQASLIGQLRLLPQKIFLDIKAGAGLSEILVKTSYAGQREESLQAFLYPTLNAGLAFELLPVKNLVFELGADYNRILSNKINFSYLMPYLEVGVRF